MLVFLGLFVLWVVLKAMGFAYRRWYNLTPVATAGSKDIRPDFLKVNHAAQKQMLDRGRGFGEPVALRLEKAAWLTNVGVNLIGPHRHSSRPRFSRSRGSRSSTPRGGTCLQRTSSSRSSRAILLVSPSRSR